MAVNKLQQISRRAKKIRKPGEKWTNAISRASRQLAGASLSPSKKKGAKKKPVKEYKPRKPVHQTGSSSKKMDERMRAKPPGKRVVRDGKGGHAYYEYRKNQMQDH